MALPTVRKAARYALMPEVLPRVSAIIGEGFGIIPFAMASVMAIVHLLPRTHPYLNPVNIGRFGIRHVLAQSAMNLRFSLRNLDQFLVFAMILTGTVLLGAQIFLFCMSAFMQVANAASSVSSIPLPAIGSFFTTAAPTQDIAFMIMDRIFGIPGLFGSCVAQNIPCIDPTGVSDGTFPNDFHIALQAMLAYYSYGLLAIAAIILCYYVVTIISETVLSGTPFGKRFSHIYAPLRLVFAFGLLVPAGNGLNTAQYIMLYTAKFGSSFATNGWSFYLTSLGTSTTLLGSNSNLVARPKDPAMTELLQFLAIAVTCREAYRVMYGIPIHAYFIRSGGTAPYNYDFNTYMTSATPQPYYEMQKFFDFGDVKVAFGHYDSANPDQYKQHLGRVRPYCGVFTLASKRVVKPPAGQDFYDGADKLQYEYLSKFLYYIWNNAGASTTPSGTLQQMGEKICRLWLPEDGDPSTTPPRREEIFNSSAAANDSHVAWYRSVVNTLIASAHADMVSMTDWTNTATAHGWAGAGMWYTKIAQVNGVFTDAVFNLPSVTSYPELYNFILERKSQFNSMVSGETLFDPVLRDGSEIILPNVKDKPIVLAMNQMYKLWNTDTMVTQPKTRNAFVDTINMVFKQSGIWAFRDNESVHPLSSLASLGRSILINSVISFGAGGATGIAGILAGSGFFGGLLSSISSFVMTVAYIGLAVGVMLYYVVPFMPFIYFFFAIVSWAKTLFEAMVGIPLWALAHLRYDGEGFPTKQALQGYYLLLDIFLRPFLIVVGLIASSVIFYALVRTLNNIFTLVTSNLSGFDIGFATTTATTGETGAIEFLRGSVDKLFFTIFYAIIVYMIGLSCFKLVDLFPNNIMRWLGGGARSFGSQFAGDEGAQVASTIKGGAQNLGNQTSNIVGGMTGSKPRTEESPD